MTDLTIFVLGSFVAGIVLTAVLVLEWAALTSTNSAHPVAALDPALQDGGRVDGGTETSTS